MTSPHEQALAAETPMADHVANFWHLLETETVRILVNIKRENEGMGVYWDSASFPDDVAKELVAARRPALPSVEGLVAEFETGRFATWLQALNWCARAAEALRSLSAKLAAVERARDTLPAPDLAEQVKDEPVAWPKIMYVCEYCQEHNPEMCGHDRADLYVTPDGKWLCDGCLDEEGIAHVDCVSPPKLYTTPPASAQAVPEGMVLVPRADLTALLCTYAANNSTIATAEYMRLKTLAAVQGGRDG